MCAKVRGGANIADVSLGATTTNYCYYCYYYYYYYIIGDDGHSSLSAAIAAES